MKRERIELRARALRALATAVAGAIATGAAAAPIPITNAGFEDLYLGSNLPPEYSGDVPAGAFPVGPAPAGWSVYSDGGLSAGAFVGVLNPGTAADHAPNPAFFPGGSPEGDNSVLLYMDGDVGGNAYGVEQVLGAALQANTVYTLTARVGNIASGTGLVEPFLSLGFYNLDGFPGYRVQLLAGGQVIAEDAGVLSSGEGEFALATVQHVTGANPAQIGQTLSVRLVNRNQPDIPSVRGLEVDFDDVHLDASPAPALPVSSGVVALLSLTLVVIAAMRLRQRRA